MRYTNRHFTYLLLTYLGVCNVFVLFICLSFIYYRVCGEKKLCLICLLRVVFLASLKIVTLFARHLWCILCTPRNLDLHLLTLKSYHEFCEIGTVSLNFFCFWIIIPFRRTETCWPCDCVFNPLDFKGNYSATSNNTKLIYWPVMGGLLHLVQRGGATTKETCLAYTDIEIS